MKKAKERNEYYVGIQISAIVNKVARKLETETNLKQLNKEKGLLVASFTDISQKYDALHTEMENNQRGYVHEQNGRLLQLKEQSLGDKEMARKWLNEVLVETRSNNQQAIAQAREAAEHQ